MRLERQLQAWMRDQRDRFGLALTRALDEYHRSEIDIE